MIGGNQSLLKQAEIVYDAQIVSENSLGNSENLIFELSSKANPLILRVSDDSERKKAHIDFELKWMQYLSGRLDTIVKPISSQNNRLYEIIPANKKSYILCAFEKAKGKPIDTHNPSEFNDSLFYNLGAIMGNMHRLTIEYSGNVVQQKFEWYNDWTTWPEYNIVIDNEIQPYSEKYISELRSLPKTKNVYGIIHGDVQPLNFFVEKGRIKIFDFDDCQFSWYANDIAISLFQMVLQTMPPFVNAKERIEFAETYLLSYLKGYLQTNTIDKYWILKLDIFMKYRMTTTYKFVQNIFKDESVNPHQQYLDWLKESIMSDSPFVAIDYKKIVNSIPGIPTLFS